MPKKDKEVALLPSERKQYEDKIKALKNEKDTIFGAVTRKHNSIIIRADYLTTDQKEKLLAQILAS